MWSPTISSDELYHYGILGQKWGKRNGPPYPLNQSSKSFAERKYRTDKGHSTDTEQKSQKTKENKELTNEQKKMIATGAAITAALLVTMGTMYVVKKSGLNPSHITHFKFGEHMDLSQLSDKVTTIGKETNLQRISSKSIEDYASEGKSIYASYLKKDKALYKEQMPRFIKEWGRKGLIEGKDSYVHNIKLKRDVKIASERDVAEAFMKINKSDYVDSGHFTRFIQNLVERDVDANKQFISELKKKGFDGIIDYNDSKSGYGKAPLFLFNPSEIVESSKSHKLSAVERFINVMTS